ncbi:MAG: DUF4386 domain-containing protein [Candidatus Bathyarchaeota archaeon]|nr:DUF4386 domain-containing protein [Candidatus Bathyarchaeota archaeon]
MVVEVVLSGFLFWFIIVTNVASGRFGYETFSSLDAQAQLQKIASDQRCFKTATALILAEHMGILALALSLFLAFNVYSLLLAALWVIFRSTEAAIQIYNKKSYYQLHKLARQHQTADKTQQHILSSQAHGILKTKNHVFLLAQLLFSAGTLAYSALFVVYATLVPPLIGWFGIAASITYAIGNAAALAKPHVKAPWNFGALLILVFEVILGTWLLLSFLL